MRASVVLTTAFAVATLDAPSRVEAKECVGTYVVQRGDTLSLIAERTMGDVLDYRELYAANRDIIGFDPAVLEVGTVLTIPCEAADTTTAIDEGALVTEPGTALVVDPAGEAGAPQPPREATLAAEALATETDNEVDEGPARPERSLGLRGFVGAAALAARVNNDLSLQVIDVRATGETAAGYIPRAHAMPVELWTARATEPDGVSRLLADNGINARQPIVIVAADTSRAGLSRAAVVTWHLRSAGVRDIGVLWGGYEAWTEKRRSLWAGPVTPRARSLPLFDVPPKAAVARDWRAVADGRAPGMILDLREGARLPDVTRGTEVAKNADRETGVVVGPPPPPLGQTPSLLALGALDWVKTLPVAWERTPIGITAADPNEAALAWFLAREVAGIRDVWLVSRPSAGIADENRLLRGKRATAPGGVGPLDGG